MKIYKGKRLAADDEVGGCQVLVIEDGGGPHPLRHVVKHSPTGFGWGYGGSGPADLALSILADYFGERPTKDDLYHGRGRAVDPRLYQPFKWQFIATASPEGFTITGEEISEWLKSVVPLD